MIRLNFNLFLFLYALLQKLVKIDINFGAQNRPFIKLVIINQRTSTNMEKVRVIENRVPEMQEENEHKHEHGEKGKKELGLND